MSSRRHNQQVQAEPPRQGVAISKQIRYNQDGKQESTQMVSSIPKLWEVLPRNAVSTTPFNGAEPTIEFELPEHLGKITDQILQFDVRLKTAAGGNVTLLPTTYWFKSVALLYNGQEVERVDADDIHNETINYCTDQQFHTIRELVNVSSSGAVHAPYSTPESGAWNAMRRFYLPLWANFANTAQLFPAGFKATWKYRLTFASNIVHTSTGTATEIEVTNPKLFVVEQQLDEKVFNDMRDAHQSGIVYRSILRNKFTKNEPSIPTTNDYNAILTSFTTDSAGLVVYVKPDSSDPALALTRHPLDFVSLRNWWRRQWF